MAEIFSIDIHTHILPENIPDFGSKYGYRGFIHAISSMCMCKYSAPCR